MAMAAATPGVVDGLSDYGSDFASDEEEILKGLLDQGPNIDNPNLGVKLRSENVEDDDLFEGIKVPSHPWGRDSDLQKTAHLMRIGSGEGVRIKVDTELRNTTEKSWSTFS